MIAWWLAPTTLSAMAAWWVVPIVLSTPVLCQLWLTMRVREIALVGIRIEASILVALIAGLSWITCFLITVHS